MAYSLLSSERANAAFAPDEIAGTFLVASVLEGGYSRLSLPDVTTPFASTGVGGEGAE